MIRKVIFGSVLIIAAAMLQSTVFSRFSMYIHAMPDLALVILVYTAYVNGLMTGQLTGFFSGIFLDLLSASPLGLNSLVRTIAGAIAGFIKGTFYMDLIFLPMALCAGATALKALILIPLHLLFPLLVPSYSFSGLTFWIELGFNTVMAPLIFGLLKLFKPLQSKQKDGF